MKQLFILLFVLATLYSKGQAKLEMSSIYAFSPANADTPTSSVTYSTPVSMTIYVKNTGNTAFNGSISVNAKRDTIGGVFCDSISITTLLPFLPGDSLQGTLSFTPTPGATGFKVAGNGNTIVVWPFASGVVLGDSLRNTLWINDASGIKEMEPSLFQLFPNPATNFLNIKPIKPFNYKKIIIYDMFAKKIKELSYSEIIDVSELKSGYYCIIISSETGSYRLPFVKE